MKKFLIFLLVLNTSIYSQTLSKELNKYLNQKYFDTTLISIQVENLSKGKTIFKKNEKLLLHPASNMKLITSAAAIIFLGTDYEFSTSLFYDGNIKNDTLFGDIIFVGGCDPDFTTSDFYSFLDEIKNLEIKFIKGNLVGDISFKDKIYWGKGWMWDDDPSSDVPRLSALNLNDNCVLIEFKKDEISIHPKTNFIKVYHLPDADDFQIDRNWLENKNKIIIKGKSNFPHSEQVNIVEPERYFLTVFSEVLDSNDIDLSGDILVTDFNYDNKNFIHERKRKLTEVLPNLNKNSDNLSAEMLLYAMGEKYFSKPSSAEKGLKVIEMFFDSLNLSFSDYRIVDGSGVSHYNLVSTEVMIKLLKFMFKQPPEIFDTFLNSLPISGIDGTLKNRMKNDITFSKVFAKTGTLSGVSCLSGYIRNKNDDMIAFSIFIQNFVGSSKQATDIQDKICEIIYLND